MSRSSISSCALAALTCLASVMGTGLTSSGDYRPKVGEPHPDFVLPHIDTGQPVALSQLRGKKVILIHFASW
jgi:hypothetical protein